MTSPISGKFFLTILAVFLIGRLVLMWIQPMDEPSEARYAVMCKNMAESGNFLEPKFIFRGEFQTFEGKPALPFQLGAVSCLIFGSTPFATRVPSFIAMCLILWGVYTVVKKFRDIHTAYTAVLLTLCSAVFFQFGGLMMTDMVLCMTIFFAIVSYMLFVVEEDSKRKKRYSLMFFFWLGAGMAAKGPVAIVMAGLPVFFYVLINCRWKELKYHSWLLGPIVFLIPCLPWYICMTIKNPDFLYYFFIEENFQRFLHPGAAERFGAARESCYGMAIVWFILANIPLVFSLPMFKWARIKAFYNLGRSEKREARSEMSCELRVASCELRVASCEKNCKSSNEKNISIFSDPLTGLSFLTVITIPAFWCLTSQSLLPYLIPTIPALAIFIAVRFRDIGELTQPVRLMATKTFVTICALCFTVGTMIVLPMIYDRQPNLNTAIYHKLQDLKQDPKWKDVPMYFMGLAPYSAEFYLEEGQFVNHKPEPLQESYDRSASYLLVASIWNEKDLGKPIPRKLLFKCQAWSVYEPKGIYGVR